MLLVGYSTVGSREEAEQLARLLVVPGGAACVQIDGPIVSLYTWEGKLERAEEFRLCVKFLPANQQRVFATILNRHPYQVPEWVVVRAEEVGEKYLSWAQTNSSTRPL